jgi:hypothetical protein
MRKAAKARSTFTTQTFTKLTACAAVTLPMLAGCGGPAPGDESVESNEIGSSPEALGSIPALGLSNQHLNFRAAESVISTHNPITNRHVVTYNAEDSLPYLEYTAADRFIMKNASLLAWADWRTDGVVTHEGRVRPPAGWSVLWGDPAVERNRADRNFLYIANLAVPDNKWPSQQYIQGPITTSQAGLCGSFIGGACIARSTNDGQTFTVSSGNCIKRTSAACPAGHFYDGASLAPTFNVSGGTVTGTGRMFAAFNDVTRGRHDVYQQQIIGGSFLKVTDFNVPVILHPRLRYGRTKPNAGVDAGALYMLYQQQDGRLGLARYDGGGGLNGPWAIATWTAPVTAISQNPVVLAPGLELRTGPEYDFDIGYNDANVQEIRIVYTVSDPDGRLHVNGASCVVNFPTVTCSPKAVWSTQFLFPTRQQWNPRISFGNHPAGGAVWHYSFYHSVPGTGNVEVWKTRVTNSSMGPVQLQEPAQLACPDNRGYWGDYDNMVPTIGGQFLRPFTDSSHAGCVRQTFNATPMFASLTGWLGN